MIGACPLTSCAPADVTQTAQRAFSTDPPNRPPCPVTPESDTLRLYGQQRRRCAFLAGPAPPREQHAAPCVGRTAQRVPASSGRAPVSCRAACRAARRAGGHCRWRGLRCAVPVVPAQPQDHHGTSGLDRTAQRECGSKRFTVRLNLSFGQMTGASHGQPGGVVRSEWAGPVLWRPMRRPTSPRLRNGRFSRICPICHLPLLHWNPTIRPAAGGAMALCSPTL